MESAKEKAIREAYGEHWETVKQDVDDNGYLYHPKGGEVTFDPFIGFMEEHPTDDAYRPKCLQGIETNNAWVSLEEEQSNPKESGYYWVTYKSGNMGIANYNNFYNKWMPPGCYYLQTKEESNIIAYQPIETPKPPIY